MIEKEFSKKQKKYFTIGNLLNINNPKYKIVISKRRCAIKYILDKIECQK